MDRREFLAGLAALGVLGACDGGATDDTGDTDTDTDTDTTVLTCTMGDGDGDASGGGHTHTVTIPQSDVEDGAEGTYTSSSTSGHTHQVHLTAGDMTTLRDDCEVEVTTSDEGHTHTWTIRLPEA